MRRPGFKLAPRRAGRSSVLCWIAAWLWLGTEVGVSQEMQPATESDLAAARRVFEANLDAIRQKNRDAYLATYLQAPTLARSGPAGIRLGYDDHAASSSDDNWPDVFQARDLRLVPVQPGVVYGAYRYRVRYGDDESAGLSERVFLDTPEGWRIAVTSAFESPPGTPPPAIALVGATLIDGTGGAPIENAVVVLRGGRVECAGNRGDCPNRDGIESMDVTGMWITPGIVDAHVHFSQTGWADGRPDAMDLRQHYPYAAVQAELRAHPERLFRSYLASGVTAVFDVGGYPWTWNLRDTLSTEQPHVAASGPLLSTRDFWLNLPGERQFIHLADEDAARQAVRYLGLNNTDAVKVWFIPDASRSFEDLERVVLAAGDETRRAALRLIVHATGLREAKVALRAGARLLVHSVRDTLVDQEFLDLARRQQTIYCPTLVVAEGYARMFEALLRQQPPAIDISGGAVDPLLLARIEESVALAQSGFDEARLSTFKARLTREAETMRANLRTIQQAGILIAMGTDAGNPLTLHGPAVHAEMEAMQAAGMSPMQTLVAATSIAAQAMGRGPAIGSIEEGKSADLLILAADPTQDIANMRQIRFIVRGGEIRSQAELAWQKD